MLKTLRGKLTPIYPYTLYAILIFLTSSCLGYYTAATQTNDVFILLDQITEEYSVLASYGPITLFLLIFLNNTIKTFFMMMLGIFFGLTPILFLFANGYILGIFFFVIAQKTGSFSFFLGTIPHGIIELPVVLMAAAYGLWLGHIFVQKLRNGKSIKRPLKKAYRVYLTRFVPLFFIAAAIEVFITDSLLTFFGY